MATIHYIELTNHPQYSMGTLAGTDFIPSSAACRRYSTSTYSAGEWDKRTESMVDDPLGQLNSHIILPEIGTTQPHLISRSVTGFYSSGTFIKYWGLFLFNYRITEKELQINRSRQVYKQTQGAECCRYSLRGVNQQKHTSSEFCACVALLLPINLLQNFNFQPIRGFQTKDCLFPSTPWLCLAWQ